MSGSSTLALVAIVSGCGGSPADSAPAAPAGVDCATDTGGAAPGWQDWGAGFFGTWCQPCHATDAPQRYGAPEGVAFDDAAQAVAQADAIRRVVLEQERMPVGGGLSAADRDRLAAWLCAVEAP